MASFIILGGGCFWGMQHLLRTQKGVIATEVGYAGGSIANPSYRDICSGLSGHAEVVKIDYDQELTNLEQVLHYFFKIHDPTTLHRQGGDVGTQYRSVVFYQYQWERDLAVKHIEMQQSRWQAPIVTTVEKLCIDHKINYYKAEEYHQDYLIKNPGGYSCHWERS